MENLVFNLLNSITAQTVAESHSLIIGLLTSVTLTVLLAKRKFFLNYLKKNLKKLVAGDNQITAALLCFFLGNLGVHRFYLGYAWQGVVQLLTFGLCGIWTLIDFIRILVGDLQPKNGSYSKTI